MNLLFYIKTIFTDFKPTTGNTSDKAIVHLDILYGYSFHFGFLYQ